MTAGAPVVWALRLRAITTSDAGGELLAFLRPLLLLGRHAMHRPQRYRLTLRG